MIEDAVPLALVFMIAYKRAYNRHRIILKQHFARAVNIALQKCVNHIGNRRIYRAPLPAHGLFTV